MAVVCREVTTNAPLLVLILNRVTGTVLATLNAGGGDQIAYDASSNRYYEAASRWTASGLAAAGGNCSSASPCTPVLWVIDAGARTAIQAQDSGNNAHSVALDPATHQLYMPYSSGTAPPGCASICIERPNGGVLVFAIP